MSQVWPEPAADYPFQDHQKRFVGCEGYPDCDQTYPLPQRSDIIGMNEVCPQCSSPKIKILGSRRPWILCLDPYCPTKAEYREKRAARAAEGAEAASKKAAAKTATAKTKTAAKKTATTRKKAAPKKATTRKKAAAPATPAAPADAEA